MQNGPGSVILMLWALFPCT